METVYNVAGIDVHKQVVMVVIGSAGQSEKQWERKRFGTLGSDLKRLGEWLREKQVAEVAMESTAQYWKPVWMALEEEFVLHLAQARSTKGAKGRKSDWRDARRIVKRLLSDDLTLSYVPEAEQRLWRLMTRTREQLVKDRVRLRNQVEGLLEEGQIKLSSVVSDLFGASGRRILRALASGQTNAEQLAQLGDERLQVSRPRLEEALRGQMRPTHAHLLQLFLQRLELLDQQIEDLGRELSEAMRLHQDAITRLCEMPGILVGAAQQIVAEVGPEAVAFPSGPQLCSWVGQCPGEEGSGGRFYSSRSPKGNRPMRRLMNQVAWAAVRTKGSRFQGLFQRSVGRLGPKKAICMVAHQMLLVIWKILHEHASYIEFGALANNPKARERRNKRLIRELRRQGYTVQRTALPA